MEHDSKNPQDINSSKFHVIYKQDLTIKFLQSNISLHRGYRLMTYRPKDTQERIHHRLKIAKGHLEKVIKMIESDEYCIDVMHQLQAVESGLKETGNVLLENHLKTCVADAISQGKTDESIAEIMQVFKKKS